ncbi:hypothetical protein G9P44_002787 [Scheffersomyces stipitis]|nr:hypothetical protein G9P44_002787 [Scheffersomyces stipitis]
MSKAKKLESEVVESPDDIQIPAPDLAHTLIRPFEFLVNSRDNCHRNALVILNQSLTGIDVPRLWSNTELHVCADGGANQLYDYFEADTKSQSHLATEQTSEQASDLIRRQYIPQFIVGDLDSLRDDVRDYYERKGARIIPQYTQYSTDFSKAIATVRLYYYSEASRQVLVNDSIDTNNGLAEIIEKYEAGSKQEQTVRIYILSGIGGRFDQTIHSISQLYILNQSHPFLQHFFITTSDLIFLLKKGVNYVAYPSKTTFHSAQVPTCGLLPLGNSKVMISSHGLKYDVRNWESEMLGNVSSSNGISGVDGVVVEVSGPLVMNIEIEHGVEDSKL